MVLCVGTFSHDLGNQISAVLRANACPSIEYYPSSHSGGDGVGGYVLTAHDAGHPHKTDRRTCLRRNATAMPTRLDGGATLPVLEGGSSCVNEVLGKMVVEDEACIMRRREYRGGGGEQPSGIRFFRPTALIHLVARLPITETHQILMKQQYP